MKELLAFNEVVYFPSAMLPVPRGTQNYTAYVIQRPVFEQWRSNQSNTTDCAHAHHKLRKIVLTRHCFKHIVIYCRGRLLAITMLPMKTEDLIF